MKYIMFILVIIFALLQAQTREFIKVTENFNSIDVGEGSTPSVIDLDNDGLLDLIIGNSAGKFTHYEQDSENSTSFSIQTPQYIQKSDSTDIVADDYSTLYFIDIDSDGLLDLITSDANNHDKIVVYEQTSINSKSFDFIGTLVSGPFASYSLSPTCTDLDNDGLIDLIVGRRRGEISHYEQVSINSYSFTTRTHSFNGINVEDFNRPVLTDFYNNGILDFVIGQQYKSNLNYYKQDSLNSVLFSSVTGTLLNEDVYTDLDAPFFTDIDGDGLLDLLVGHYWGKINHYEASLVSTYDIGNITVSTADCESEVAVDFGTRNITARGVCWSTASNPTISGTHTSDGTGLGSFTSSITGLTQGTKYYVRPYATETGGTTYGREKSFTTDNIPSVTTDETTDITSTTATSGGNVASDNGDTVILRGVCWDTNSNPTTSNSHTEDGSGTGEFISPVTGLSQGTLYYLRSYATNSVGRSYGNQQSFTTDDIPSVTTDVVTNIATTTATSGGNVTSENGDPVTLRGVCWSTNENPTTADSHTEDGNGTGEFTSSITGLLQGTLYFVRAYAINGVGTAYGEQRSFTTDDIPYLTTEIISNISDTTADGGGEVTSVNGEPVTVRGVCWSTEQNPTTADSFTDDGSGLGTYSSNLSGLTKGTEYFVRAYGSNSIGTGYGNEVSFTTDDVPSEVINSIFLNSDRSALISSEVTNNNGNSVSERGVCWSTNHLPDINDDYIANGSGTGVYETKITGLNPDTYYFVRAYATNSVGTSYSEELGFGTKNDLRNTLYFNGSDQYASIPLTLPNSGTIETWVKLDNISNSHTIFDAGSASSNFRLNFTSYDGYYARIGNSSLIHESYSTVNKWHHVAFVWNKRTEVMIDLVDFYFYLNGNLVGAIFSNTWTNPASSLKIGSTYLNSLLHKGYLDEFRIWNYQRSIVEIQSYMHKKVPVSSFGLLCYFDFDQTNGNYAIDRTTNGNNGVLNNNDQYNWLTSTAPFGDQGLPVRSDQATSAGDTNKDITSLITSGTNLDNFLGIYTYGTGESTLDAEEFPVNIIYRKDIIWGSYEFGNVTSDITLDYSGLLIPVDDTVRLLKRDDATSDWTDFTSSATHDEVNDTFSLLASKSFPEFSVGIYVLNNPQNIVTAINGTNLELSWDVVTGATSYVVYSSDDPYGIFEEATGTFDGLSWSQPYTSKMFYYVVAVSGGK